MIWNITVDGEEALAVDTAEELGRALVTGRYVVASDAGRELERQRDSRVCPARVRGLCGPVRHIGHRG